MTFSDAYAWIHELLPLVGAMTTLSTIRVYQSKRVKLLPPGRGDDDVPARLHRDVFPRVATPRRGNDDQQPGRAAVHTDHVATPRRDDDDPTSCRSSQARCTGCYPS